MPELPEVETVRQTLLPAVGARITKVWDSGLGLHMKRKPPRAKLKKLVGAQITELRRIGKYLLVDTDTPHSLLVHLGMTGRFRLHAGGDARAKHTHLVLSLADGRELRFSDARRFGQLDIVARGREREHVALKDLGPDPIVDGIDPAAFFARSRKKRRAQLKAFILDQTVLAGVGNIYASEALWLSKLRPTKRAGRLTEEKAAILAKAIDDVLRTSLANHGTSLRDFVDGDGAEGSNYDYLKVYDRKGQPCPRCKTSIRRSVLQGRATYFCPTCQTP
ncbi:MAG: bifunctional DNA-formamidopyrimidine glycosylase/DNA-(apurinic or apyrimidinic site) lyase [Kofleriaceae bacterium]